MHISKNKPFRAPGFFQSYIPAGVVLIFVLVFFIYKLPCLKLPFFWDEAWVYGPAVRLMARTGISLIPDALPIEYSRGHPLLFHALNATWLRIFGNTITMAHLFNLFVACGLVLTLFALGGRFFHERTGLACAFILLLQPVFLAQSVLVLPEVMLALFCLLSLYFFLMNQWWGYFLSATAALLTKETGVAVIITASLMIFITNLKNRVSWKLHARSWIVTCLPTLPLMAFLALQKLHHGWFLFPDHLSFVSFKPLDFLNTLKFIFSFTFFDQGRFMLLWAMLISATWLFIRKKEIIQARVIITLLMFILVFSLIGSANYFTKRYALAIIPPFLLISMGIILSAFRRAFVLPVVLCAFSLAQLPNLRVEKNADHNLGYMNPVRANQAMIAYCLQHNLQQKRISVYFIGMVITTNPLSGYIKETERFNICNDPGQADYLIVSNYDTDNYFLSLRHSSDLILEKRIAFGAAWIELYRRNTFQQPH